MKSIRIESSYLWFLTLGFTMAIIFANWFAARFVNLHGLITDGGTLIFPLTFLLSDLITEVYGYKHARRAIWCGFLFNAIFIAYGQLIIHLPDPDFPNNNAMFATLFRFNSRIIIASAISYLIAEPVNSIIIAKLKLQMHGRYMSIRFVFSTMIASLIDSMIFSSIAFYGLMSGNELIKFILTMWFIKIVIEILGLPLSIYLANWLKQKEQMDIYDNKTNFNLFSLDTTYPEGDNEYRER